MAASRRSLVLATAFAGMLVALCTAGVGAARPTRSLSATPTPTDLPSTTEPPPPVPQGIKVTRNGLGSEQNVCDEGGRCGASARVEVEVPNPGVMGNTTFAPLCAPDYLNDTDKAALAYVICNQYYNWPKSENWRTNPDQIYSVMGFLDGPVLIPKKVAKGAKDLFNPSNYKYWATISGWGSVPRADVRAVQVLTLKVSKSPCSKARMLGVMCMTIVADHRRHMLRH